MKELENVMSQLERETKKKEQAENKIKLLKQKKSKLKRSADTKRKVEKGGVFEAFEREITGMQEETNNDLIYAFLDYVLSDNRNREKLKGHTDTMIEKLSRYIKSTGKTYQDHYVTILNWYEQDKDKLSQKKNGKIPTFEDYDKGEHL